jgi:AcrR family transcriptional regulator
MGRKGDLQRIKVIESASYCLAHFGEKGTTFQVISEHSKLSQASVVKYLKSKDNIFPEVLNYWITRARDVTEKAIDPNLSGEQKLRNYLKVSYDLFFEAHEISMTIMTLHYLAGVEEKYRVINTQIKDIAQERIGKMIEDGIKDGSFKKTNVKLAAKTIHNSLNGYLLSSIAETKKPIDLQAPAALEEMCIKFLK